MPDDERTRRRLGDDTKARIADLASGWSVDGDDSPPSAVPPDPPAGTPAPTRPPPPPRAATPPAPVRATTPSAPPAPRSKPRTNPPPPPGSAQRKAIEDKIIATTPGRDDRTEDVPDMPARVAKTATEELQIVSEGRGVSPTGSVRFDARGTSPAGVGGKTTGSQSAAARAAGPQPAIDTRPKSPSAVDPRAETAAASEEGDASTGPRYPRAGYQGAPPPLATERRATTPKPGAPDEKPFAKEQRTPAIIVDDPQLRDAANLARIPTETGELLLEDAEPDNDDDANDTQRKVADVEARIAALEPSRGDATMLDPQTAKFDRSDPTVDHKLDATELQAPTAGSRYPTGGTVRRTAALRRQRGLLGDVRYVFTALFGVRRAKSELAEFERKQELRNSERRKYLVTLGRAAVVTDSFDHPQLGKARDALQRIEEERGRHSGAVAASDAELERVRRDREAKAKAHGVATAAADTGLAELAKKLEPLEKEAAGIRKRSIELRDSLGRIERKIAETEALVTSVKAEKLDKAAIQADLATYKADKLAVLRDEPGIAAELDALNPRIASIEANRAELLKKKQDLDKAEKEDHGRTLELLDAIGAKRKVVERAAVEAEQARDGALFELGDRLYVDRPKLLANLLSPIDQIDLELGEGERRSMELREILSNIDKAKFARGAAMIILVATVIGCFVWWLVSALT